MRDFSVPTTKKDMISALEHLYRDPVPAKWIRMSYDELYVVYCSAIQPKINQY